MRLRPRKDLFFDLLERQAATVLLLCERFHEMVRDFTDLEARQAGIKELEHAGDELTHELFNAMHSTFVTPLDKSDLAALAAGLDDIADYVDAAGDRFLIYRIEAPTEEVRELAGMLVASARTLLQMIQGLRDLRGRDVFFERFREMHALENESDRIYRRALGKLFDDPAAHPIQVIKWREIYERVEMAVDKCEDVANVVEGIVLKYS